MSNFTIVTAEQRSDEWKLSRLGRVTGSMAKCVMMGEKTAGRADYVLQLALERMTGAIPEQGYTNAEMQRGIDLEPMARMCGEEKSGLIIRETGFLSHNTKMIGASLDGDSNDFGIIWELKCPKSTTHVGYLRSNGEQLLKDYIWQLTHNVLVSDASVVIIGSYDDRMPMGLDWVMRSVYPKDLPLAEYETALDKFLLDVDNMVFELTELQQNGFLGSK